MAFGRRVRFGRYCNTYCLPPFAMGCRLVNQNENQSMDLYISSSDVFLQSQVNPHSSTTLYRASDIERGTLKLSDLMKTLQARGFIYRRGNNWKAYKQFVDAGLFCNRQGLRITERGKSQIESQLKSQSNQSKLEPSGVPVYAVKLADGYQCIATTDDFVAVIKSEPFRELLAHQANGNPVEDWN